MLTCWTTTMRGSQCSRPGECNGCPAFGALPIRPMFPRHRMRCVSAVR
jgi:hypothetical protein